MQARYTEPRSDPSQDLLAEALTSVLEVARFPKVQLERCLGPLLHRYIAPLVGQLLGCPDVQMLAPEFPLRVKPGRGMQSFNIDWMLYVPSEQRLVFVELKTSRAGFSSGQLEDYESAQREIAQQGAGQIIAFVKCLENHTGSPKYKHLNQQIERLGNGGDIRCSTLVYLSPCAAQWTGLATSVSDATDSGCARRWFAFSELPAVLSDVRVKATWPAVHAALQKAADQDAPSFSAGSDLERSPNYQRRVDYDEAVRLARAQPQSLVIGFTGGMAALQNCVNNDLNHLFQRRYKVDGVDVSGRALSAGQKVWRNWIAAQDFLRITQGSADVQARHRAIADLKARYRQAAQEWQRMHPGMAVNGSFSVDDQGAVHVVVGEEQEEQEEQEEEEAFGEG